MGLGQRIEDRLEAAEISQSELARRVGTRQSTINSLIHGKSQSSSYLHKIARELRTTVEYLTGETDDPSIEALTDRRLPYDYGGPSRRDNEDLVEIAEIDARYGLGETDISGPIASEMRTFSRGWLQTITRTAPEYLFWAITQGDSMEPTIRSGELVLIDRSQDTLRERDQIWACTVSDFGAIKRLRPMSDGSVAILSDNPNVPEDRAFDEELFIIGRVIARVGKL